GDAVLDVLEDAVAEAMPRAVAALAADRPGHGRPHLAGVLVTQVERLTAGIADRVVVPGGEPELVRVLGPGVAGRAVADHAAEIGVGQHVRPRRRRHSARAGLDDVLAAVGGERTDAVVEDPIPGDGVERPWVDGVRRRVQVLVGITDQVVLHRIGHQQWAWRGRGRPARDLLGERAAGIADDHPGHRLQPDAIVL